MAIVTHLSDYRANDDVDCAQPTSSSLESQTGAIINDLLIGHKSLDSLQRIKLEPPDGGLPDGLAERLRLVAGLTGNLLSRINAIGDLVGQL